MMHTDFSKTTAAEEIVVAMRDGLGLGAAAPDHDAVFARRMEQIARARQQIAVPRGLFRREAVKRTRLFG